MTHFQRHQNEAQLDAGSEEKALFDRLNQRKPSTKEIESTLPGQPSTVVESWLPSFFEVYPRVLKAYRHSGGLELLRSCDYMLRTGDPSEMNRLTAQHSPPPEVIVIEDEQDYSTPAIGSFYWQADGGACGWLDYEPFVNQMIEAARVEGRSHVRFSIRGQSYKLDLKRMLQVNLASSTARPVRMVAT